MVEDKKIFTVTELNRAVRKVVEDALPGVWVEGEISNFILHTSGHMYFSLKDATATLRCAMFSRSNARLKFRPKDGMKVICFGRVSVYEPRGDYQLIVDEIEPKGVGALQLAFQELKERLQKEGLFDQAHKVPIPKLPTAIGVVTSPTGAAIHDILTVARRRFANVEIIINPVRVQGEGAKEEIAQAIRDFNAYGKIDVMIVGRGGGSLEDLWAFNEEVVARAIYESGIPVISAVGHEIDFSISDFVADLRAATPSAAAELVIPEKEELVRAISAAGERMRLALQAKLDVLAADFARLRDSYALRQPLAIVTQYAQRIDECRKDLAVSIGHIVAMEEKKFHIAAGKLGALSPLAILGRGYSITAKLPAGIIVRNAGDLAAGDEIETRLGSGSVRSRVEGTTPGAA